MAADTAFTEAESRIDRARRRVGVWLGPALFLAVLLAPTGLTPAAHRLAAVMGWVITWWITEPVPLPVTAVLGPALAVLLNVTGAREAFAPFGDPVIFLFLGSFLLAEALRVHGLDRRMALGLLSVPGVSASPGRIRVAVALVTAAVSMWISNTATAAMMLPIALGLVRALSAAGSRESPRGILLLVGIAASIGGVATPVGTPPNLIALGFLEQAGHPLDFLRFMAVGLPLSLGLSAVTLLVVRALIPQAPSGPDVGGWVARERAGQPPWGAGQWACAVVFGLAVAFWLVPGVATLLAAPGSPLRIVSERLEESMFDSGLAPVLGRSVVQATGVSSLWGLTALVLGTTIVLTELASNTATVSMLAPLVLALCRELGLPSVPPLLAVCFGASMGFMFPVGTPPNAIVYGTGLIPLTAMMRVGVIVDLLSFFVIFGAVRVLCPLLGLA